MTGPVVYLDHNATAPLLPEARAAIVAALDAGSANPSSVHAAGRRARDTVERARREVAALLGALPEEVVFTSGGTEGDHLAIRGLSALSPRRRLISSRLEHPAVQGALEELTRQGFTVTWLPVGATGVVEPSDLRAALADDVALVTLATVNHELGTLNPIAELAAAARGQGALFHTDAVQAAGRIPLDVRALGVDAATVSAHKLGGPPGAGAVFLRRGLEVAPLLAGGHQERERRAGTENVAGIAGMGAACARARRDLAGAAARVASLRDRLEGQLLAIPGARRHGDPARRAPGTSNLGFAGAPGHLVLIGLDLEGICVSTGAACTSGSVAPSPVLLTLGLSPAEAREAVRFSLGPGNTEEEIDRAARATAAVVARVRAAAAEEAA